MATKPAPKANEDPKPAEGGDVEGHSMWVDPSSARHLARSKNADIERHAREAKRAKEAKKG
jgi:hypothetical protein